MASTFALDLAEFARKAGANSRAVVKKVVLDAGSSVVVKTPVGDPSTWKEPAPPGYVGGRARGSWQYAQGAPITYEPGTIDKTGQASIERVRVGVESGDAACVHYITSSIPYMRRLEYEGWSKQAPNGMVRITVAEFQKFIDDAVKSLP